MAIAFESLYSDIAGRCGKLTVGKKTVRTPALLPVINPHLPLVTPHDLQEMGVEAIITNAYIISQSRQFRERALTEGLHKGPRVRRRDHDRFRFVPALGLRAGLHHEHRDPCVPAGYRK